MLWKPVSILILSLLVVSRLALAFDVQPVKSSYTWTETIYINADGSISPLNAPISSVDNVTYTLTDNIAGSVTAYASAIIIQRDNILLDGAGYTLQGTQFPETTGMELIGTSNVTIKNIEIMAFSYGIVLDSSSYNNAVSGNNITANNKYGVWLNTSYNNTVSGNNVTANDLAGIELDSSYSNIMSGNNVTANNEYGIRLGSSFNNSFGGNNITANNNVGLSLYSSNNNGLNGNNITHNLNGVLLGSSYNNSVTGNNITQNDNGIVLDSFSYDNTVSGNNITANVYNGIYLGSSSDNSLSGNSIITNNWAGIFLFNSSDNTVSGNNIIKNIWGVELDYFSNNNSVSGNNITANSNFGIWISSSSNSNNVSGNSFVDDGLLVDYSYANVVTANMVNGKPLVYLEDVSDYSVGDAGQVVLVNCNNMTVQNLSLSNTSIGVELWATNNTKISGNNITANTRSNQYGVFLYSSSDNSVSGNNIAANNEYGIWLDSSSNYNSVSGNNIANNRYGIYFYSSSNYNSVSGNNITNNDWGVLLEASSNNTICHNNFMNFINQVSSYGSTNFWDEGYPSGGNYWSDYTGLDGNRDGIGDTAYVIDANNTDQYPLMGMFYDFTVSWIEPGYNVELISNSSVSAFDVGFWIEHPEDPNTRIIQFNITGETGTTGFCRICIPTALLNASYTVLLNGTEIPCTLLSFSNSTHSYLYFNYTYSTEIVTITPEFPSLFVLPPFMLATLLAVITYKRKRTSP